MRPYCHVSAQVDRHTAGSTEADYAERIEEELLDGDFSPFLPENIAEAVGDADAAWMSRISTLLRNEADQTLGQTLRELTTSYWKTRARTEAERRAAAIAASCSRCQGRGCQRCADHL